MSNGAAVPDRSLFASLELEGFPLAHLQASRQDRKLQARMRDRVEEAKQASVAVCPECDDTDSELSWFYFQSPQWTWEALCGRSGVIAYCDAHERQVGFWLDVMN